MVEILGGVGGRGMGPARGSNNLDVQSVSFSAVKSTKKILKFMILKSGLQIVKYNISYHHWMRMY